MKALYRYASIGIIFMYSMAGMAQIKIQLKDQVTNKSIAGAAFQYGNIIGISNNEGNIFFDYIEGVSMYLSHLNYGKWSLTDAEIKEAIKNGVFYQKEEAIDIHSVSVIAMHPKADKSDMLFLKEQDKLSHDGGAILDQIPAINGIRKSGSYGFDPVLRGFKYDQINVVINGVQSASAACPNRMDPATSQVSPNMMESVEVYKGPHALRYGGAFGGTINFVPSKPQFSVNKDTYGRMSGSYEHNGKIMRSEGLIGFRGKKYDLGFFASWSQGDDYKDGNGSYVASDFLRGSFGSSLALKLNKKQSAEILVTRNVARDVDFAALPMDLRKDDTWLFNAKHNVKLSNRRLQSWSTSVFATIVDHLMDNLLKPLDPRMMNALTDANTLNFGGRTEGIWISDNAKLYSGIDMRIEEAKGQREREFLMGPMMGNVAKDNAWQHGTINKTGFFGEYHYLYSKFNFIMSARLEMNMASIKDISQEFDGIYSETKSNQVNPSLSLGSVYHLSNKFILRLWIGRAQRSGGIAERYINYFPIGLDPYEMLGNPNLKPEVNNELDFNFEIKEKKTNIKIDIFASYLQDYISSKINPELNPRLSNSPGVRQFVNIENAVLAGGEINWKQNYIQGFYHQFSLAYTFGRDQTNDEPLPEIAPLDARIVFLGTLLKGKLHPETSFRLTTNQKRVSETFGETETPSFFLMDIGIQYRLNTFVSASVKVNNLFDEAYFEHLSRPVKGADNPIYAPGRNIGITFIIDLM